ncbi:MAG: hypothetical protein V4514_09865 [Pseudomonadota bacterium]|uniref:hypothetical protein n=1 Tax=unclassified Phenylobacterium TaxID=2640670 RepID=UPI0006F4D206|nr:MULTISPECIES: hypothetical protein [unclassified Phenylobacterium]KRB44405.1 hypothetical protein ASE02_01805 [Phenylobacterium sp. Root700]MBT9472445.1 hypothetical protein [Phenylobacterium sp.]
MRSALIATVAVVLLAGCGQSAETAKSEAAAAPALPPAVAIDPSFTGFAKPKGDDQFGYYLPAAEVKVGDYRLDNLHIAGQQGFGDWERGDRTKTYGPVMLEFVDITSPARKNALGNVTYSVKLKVLPAAYAVTDDRVRLVGKHPKLGDVRMDVKIDPAALKKSKATKGKDGVTVATGALQVGDTPFKDVAFTWRGGDWG